MRVFKPSIVRDASAAVLYDSPGAPGHTTTKAHRKRALSPVDLRYPSGIIILVYKKNPEGTNSGVVQSSVRETFCGIKTRGKKRRKVKNTAL